MAANPLSIALANILGGGAMSEQPDAYAPHQPQKLGRGQMIAGILADMLAGARGQPGQFAASLRHRQAQEDDEINWGRRRQAELEDYERKQQIEQRYRQPDISPMERDAQAWMHMTPELRSAYEAVQRAKPQFIPDGMGGGQWVQPPGASQPPPPVIDENAWNSGTPLGGPTPQASGGFRY